MDARRKLASTNGMHFSELAFVCLCVTVPVFVGCGPEPSAKQPATTGGASTSSTSSTSSTTANTSTNAPAASTTGSSTPPPSPSASAAAPTNPGSTSNPDTSLVGSLSNAEIQKVINDNIQAFDACYTLGADKQGKLEGTVTVKATVGPLGNVKESTVTKSTMKNPKVDKCVADAFKKLKFPQPRGGVAIITYPMTFGGEVVMKK